VGSCCWPHSSGAHFTGDLGLAGPWVLHKLGVPMQEPGYRSCKDSIAQCIRSLGPRPEGRRFPRITGNWLVSLRDIAETISKGLTVPMVSIPADKAGEHFGMFFGHATTIDMPGSSEWTRKTLG
jgi:hypothetical protein